MKRSRDSNEGTDNKRLKHIEESAKVREDKKDVLEDPVDGKEMPKEDDSSSAKAENDASTGLAKETENDQTDDKEEDSQHVSDTAEPEDARVSTSPVKDSTSKDSASEEVSACEKSVENSESGEKKPIGFSSFGSSFSGFSGFSGSSKFGSLANTKKPNPWAEPSKLTNTQEEALQEDPKKGLAADETDEKTSNVSVDNKDSPTENDTFAQVKLARQDVVTGEENEETIYQMKIRLYAIDLTNKEQKSWKERGTGLLKLNKAASTNKYRLVMRSDGVLRVSLNIPFVENMQVSKGFPTSLHTEKFVKFSGIEDGKPHQYAVKCSSEALRDELYEAFTAVFQK